MKSAKRISVLSRSASVSASTGFNFSSISNPMTFPAAAASARVRVPAPQPISTTVSVLPMPARATMFSKRFVSEMKFCPNCFLKEKPCLRRIVARFSKDSLPILRIAGRFAPHTGTVNSINPKRAVRLFVRDAMNFRKIRVLPNGDVSPRTNDKEKPKRHFSAFRHMFF